MLTRESQAQLKMSTRDTIVLFIEMKKAQLIVFDANLLIRLKRSENKHT